MAPSYAAPLSTVAKLTHDCDKNAYSSNVPAPAQVADPGMLTKERGWGLH